MKHHCCPNCGAALVLVNGHLARLSPAARRLVEAAPERFKRGTFMPVAQVAEAIGYSPSNTRRALKELVAVGIVFSLAYGKTQTRHSYAGVPAQFLQAFPPRN